MSFTISREPGKPNDSLTGGTGDDDCLRYAPSMQGARTINFEKVLSGKRATANRNAGAVRINNQFLSRETVIAFGATDFKGPGTINGYFSWNIGS